MVARLPESRAIIVVRQRVPAAVLTAGRAQLAAGIRWRTAMIARLSGRPAAMTRVRVLTFRRILQILG